MGRVDFPGQRVPALNENTEGENELFEHTGSDRKTEIGGNRNLISFRSMFGYGFDATAHVHFLADIFHV
jgi:hypothetical protein